jgi:hypothetical protein
MVAAGAIRRTEGYEVLLVELSSESMECPGIALGDTRERAVANAYLISAAPDLLAYMKRKVEIEEQSEFEDWAQKARPCGDAQDVRRQWQESSEHFDFCEEWACELALIDKATGARP